MYKYYDDKIYLDKAKQYLDSLINSSSSTKNGIGWGQPYTWVTPGGTLPPNNPVITTTSYCYDALKMSIDFFDNKPIRKILKDIVSFVLIDLKGNKINNDEEDSKYGYNYDYKCLVSYVCNYTVIPTKNLIKNYNIDLLLELGL